MYMYFWCNKILHQIKKHLGRFEMWRWRRMEKISWTDHVRNEEVNEQRTILQEIRKRKPSWIGHILCRNCLLKQVIEGKIKVEIEVTRRRGRRRKKLGPCSDAGFVVQDGGFLSALLRAADRSSSSSEQCALPFAACNAVCICPKGTRSCPCRLSFCDTVL
jgi:hypothetical protein